jgi:hypothetical protein
MVTRAFGRPGKVGERTITDFERHASNMLRSKRTAIRKAFEAAGVTFDGSTGLWFTEPAAVAKAENSEAPDAQNSAGTTLD